MQPQKYFPCSPACTGLPWGGAQGGGVGGWMEVPLGPHCAHEPNTSRVVGTSLGKLGCWQGADAPVGKGHSKAPNQEMM